MEILVGYTGFVGSNILAKKKFDMLFDSKNINNSFGSNPDILVYAGIPAEKFMANKFPDKDMEVINGAINNIKSINPKKIILISTIDVYDNKLIGDELSSMNMDQTDAYGRNRLYLENWVEENFENHLIVRLPGLFGKGIKKNFVYDLINFFPSKLTEKKMNDLLEKNERFSDYYSNDMNGFFSLKEISNEEKAILKKMFENVAFSAINFTDSNGVFQYYDLEMLWEHIELLVLNNIKKCNLFTEPFSINELYKYIYESDFINILTNNPPVYNLKTKYDYLFGRNDGYILGKKEIMSRIKKFVGDNK